METDGKQNTSRPAAASGADTAAFSRTPERDIFGKLDGHIQEFRVPLDVEADAKRAAAEAGMDLSSWMRTLLYGSLYGVDHVARMHENRIRRVLGKAGQSTDVTALRVVEDVKS